MAGSSFTTGIKPSKLGSSSSLKRQSEFGKYAAIGKNCEIAPDTKLIPPLLDR